MRFRPASGSAGPTSSSRLALVLSLFALVPTAVLPPHVYANLPTGAQVVHGNVNISQAGGAMNIQQASRNAIVNWQSFNIGAGNSVQINQGGVNAAMLARVTGGDASQLLGSLRADGKLFLINQRGVIVGEGATIDTAGFLASTLDVSDAEFLAGGAMTFRGDSDAGIVNLGQITASEGNVMLFAHTVKNAGEISAPKGTAALAAGTEMFLASPDDASVIVKVNLPSSTVAMGVENSGTIGAAQAELKAAGGSIYDLAVNQSGVVRATGVERRNGRVILTASGGTVGVSGAVTATNANGSGGEVLIGGDYRGENANVPNATRTVVTNDAVIDVSATAANGDGGRAIVWADESTRFLGTLKAAAGNEGGDGGFAEVSGKAFLDFNPHAIVDLSAPDGRAGTLLLDPAALTISAASNSGTSTSGADPFVFGAQDDEAVLNVTTLQNQLASSNVTIETSGVFGDVVFDAPVSWSSANTLRVNSLLDIRIKADITAASGALELYSGKAIRIISQNQDGPSDFSPGVELVPGAKIVVDRLRVGANSAPPPSGWTVEWNSSSASFNGDLDVNTLEIDLANGGAGLVVGGSDNAIGAVRTVGTGNLAFLFVEDHHGDLSVMLDSEGATAPAITVVTTGTLTLEAGSSLSFEQQADLVLASTGAGFVNLAGANPFGDNLRFLIYAADSALTSKGGLLGGDVFNHVFDINVWDDFSSDTANRFLFASDSNLPVLTYTANSLSRFYGAANPTFTASVTGLLGADVLSEVVTGAPVFSTTAEQSSGVGTYAINIGRGTLLSSIYDFAFEPGTLTIARAPLVIAANDASRRLNRANPSFTASYEGLVNGETPAVVSGLQFSTTAVQSSPEGQYAITPFGATAANYAIMFEPGTLSVAGVATLNIAANDVTRLYGAANPAFTATITGFEDSDDESIVTGLEFSTNATQRAGVGRYEITPFGATATGYEIEYEKGYLTIDRAPLTITAGTVSRTYGDENPMFTATFAGLVNDDTSEVVSGLTFATDATKRSNVGTYSLNVSGGTAANYAITHAPGAVNVTPATLVVKADDKTRVYGDPNPTPTITVTGLKNDDRLEDVVFIASGPTHFATETSGIGAYGIILQGFGSSANYDTSVQSGSMMITQRPLTIVADSKTKVYGDPNPEFTATFRGLAPFDTGAVIPNVRFSTQATQASGVSTFGILVTSDLSQNYKIGYEFGQLKITPAELGITGLTDLSRVYGRANPTLPTVGVVGLKNSDTISMLGLEFALPEMTANAGEHKYSVTARNSNYTLLGNEAYFIVEPAPLTLQVTPVGRRYGDANPTISFNLSGLAFEQKPNDVLRIDNPTDATTDVGTYNLVPELLTNNYVFKDVRGNTIRINPRLLTVDVDNHARYYGDATPGFSYVLGGDGLASFDSANAVFEDVRTAVPINEQTNVGWYRIDPIFTNNPNYLVSWSPGYLAIMPRPIEITVHNGVSFGNNNVPEDFDAEALGLDLILFDPNGSGGLGYTAEVTGLPSFASMTDVMPNLYFDLRSDNEPQGIGEAVDLASIAFPARPSRTPPQGPTEPPPDSLPGTVVEFTPGQIVVPEKPTPVNYSELIITLDGSFLLGPSLTIPALPKKDTTKDRFADVTRYIIPRAYSANNYVVTKVTNGVLTMKADPVIKADVLAREAAAAKRKEDRDKFYMNRTAAPGEVLLVQRGAYGLPRDLMPSLRAAVGFFLNQEIVNGMSDEVGALAAAMNGGLQVKSWDDLPEEKIMAFLADIHTNPEKQALVMPALMSYTMNVALKDPAQRDAQEQKLMAHITPALGEARGTFLDAAKNAQDSWVKTEGTARGTTLAGLFNGKVPYNDFVAKAVSDTMGDAMQRFEKKGEEFDLRNVGAAAGGAGVGSIVGMAMGFEKVVTSIFPHTKMTIIRGLQKAGEKATTQAVSKGLAKIGSSAAGGAGTIVSLAVTILITESIAVADNEEARKNFDGMLKTRNDPINPNELMKSDQGKAIMMLGLANLFLGGK